MAQNTAQKTREARLRRAAARQRLTLVRSSRRDPRAWDYGRYWLTGRGGQVVGADGRGARVGDPPGLTVDEVEAWLTGPRP